MLRLQQTDAKGIRTHDKIKVNMWYMYNMYSISYMYVLFPLFVYLGFLLRFPHTHRVMTSSLMTRCKFIVSLSIRLVAFSNRSCVAKSSFSFSKPRSSPIVCETQLSQCHTWYVVMLAYCVMHCRFLQTMDSVSGAPLYNELLSLQ